MIICFMGTPGSGKSYEAAKKILDNLRKGRVCYTNIDGFDVGSSVEVHKSLCNLDDYEYSRLFNFLPPHQIKDFWKHCKSGSLIVIDEVHKYFSNRDWNTSENKDFCNWASTHRHEGFDVVLITQDVERLDKAVRSLIEWTYEFRKVNFLGGAVKHKYLCYSHAGDDISHKALAKSVRTYDKRVFMAYSSYVTKDVKELGFMTHVNVLKHPVFFIIPLVFIFGLYMFFGKSSFASGDLFGAKKVITKFDDMKKQKGPPAFGVASSGIVGKPNIIEYRDLVNKPSIVSTDQKASSILVDNVHVLPEKVIPAERCDLIGDIFNEVNDHIQVYDCGDFTRKKINNRVVSEKKKTSFVASVDVARPVKAGHVN